MNGLCGLVQTSLGQPSTLSQQFRQLVGHEHAEELAKKVHEVEKGKALQWKNAGAVAAANESTSDNTLENRGGTRVEPEDVKESMGSDGGQLSTEEAFQAVQQEDAEAGDNTIAGSSVQDVEVAAEVSPFRDDDQKSRAEEEVELAPQAKTISAMELEPTPNESKVEPRSEGDSKGEMVEHLAEPMSKEDPEEEVRVASAEPASEDPNEDMEGVINASPGEGMKGHDEEPSTSLVKRLVAEKERKRAEQRARQMGSSNSPRPRSHHPTVSSSVAPVRSTMPHIESVEAPESFDGDEERTPVKDLVSKFKDFQSKT